MMQPIITRIRSYVRGKIVNLNKVIEFKTTVIYKKKYYLQ